MPGSLKTRNGWLASLASNPFLTVPILELWAKWVNHLISTKNSTTNYSWLLLIYSFEFRSVFGQGRLLSHRNVRP